jgi:hypothetical protein
MLCLHVSIILRLLPFPGATPTCSYVPLLLQMASGKSQGSGSSGGHQRANDTHQEQAIQPNLSHSNKMKFIRLQPGLVQMRSNTH